jgi:hypothetical protein
LPKSQQWSQVWPAPSIIEDPALPATRDEALALAAIRKSHVISPGFTELAARDNIEG